MKNKVRVIAAAVLTLFVLFSMCIPSLAADNDCKIVIKNTNEAVSMNGHTYRAYKIFDVVYDATTGSYDYTVAAPFGPFFAGKTMPESYGTDPDTRAYSYVAAISGDAALQAFGREIYAFLGANPEDNAAGSVTSTSATLAEITDLAPGYYLVYDEGTNVAEPTNPEKAIANVALTTSTSRAEIDLKASVPTIDKKITGVSDDATDTAVSDGADQASAKIGQHVGFQIDSIVPDLNGYTTYTYKVTDTMSDGLTPDNNVKVVIGTTDVTARLGSDNISVNGQVTTVSIPLAVLSDFDKDTPITITYSATVNANATVYPSTDANSNSAELEYSNNITDATEKVTTPSSTVNVYLFTLDITKVNVDGEKLPGAKFVLTDSTNAYIPVTKDATTGRYAVSDTLDATEANATVVSDANGKIYVDGVAEGAYTLTEIEAPDGYNLLKDPVVLTVSATYDSATGECTGVTGNTATVINKAGGILPSTGGIGTYIFTFGGAGLMIAAAFVLVSRKKKAEEN